MEVAAEMQNLLLAPLDSLISHSAKRQNVVREWVDLWIAPERAQTRPDYSTTEHRQRAQQTVVAEPRDAHVYSRSERTDRGLKARRLLHRAHERPRGEGCCQAAPWLWSTGECTPHRSWFTDAVVGDSCLWTSTYNPLDFWFSSLLKQLIFLPPLF